MFEKWGRPTGSPLLTFQTPLTLLRKYGTLHTSSTFFVEGARVGVMEEEVGRPEEGTNWATEEPSLENPPQAMAAGEDGKAAEEALAEAAEAIQAAIRLRARLFAPAPLDHAEIRLAAARDQYDAGAYSEARVIAQQALSSAVQALSHAEHQQQLRQARQRRRQRIWGYGISGVLAGALLWRWIGYIEQSRSHLAAPASRQEPTSRLPAPTERGRAGPKEDSSGSPAAPKAPTGRFVAVEAERLNVREGPGTHFPRHARPLTRGQKVRVVQEKGEWLQVDLGAGKRGWIAGKYTREASFP